MASFYSSVDDKSKDVCYGFKVGTWQFSVKFPKIPGVLKGNRINDGSRRDSQWDFCGFIGRTYEPCTVENVKRKAGSMTNLRFRKVKVEDAIPLDNISHSSDHIYAEIESSSEEASPPLLPPRADTPIFNGAPDYPPYSSKQVRLRRSRSERKALNIDQNIVLPRYY